MNEILQEFSLDDYELDLLFVVFENYTEKWLNPNKEYMQNNHKLLEQFEPVEVNHLKIDYIN